MPSLFDLGSLHVTQGLTVEPGQKTLTPISLIHRSRFLTSDQLWPGSKKFDPCRYLPLADGAVHTTCDVTLSQRRDLTRLSAELNTILRGVSCCARSHVVRSFMSLVAEL